MRDKTIRESSQRRTWGDMGTACGVHTPYIDNRCRDTELYPYAYQEALTQWAGLRNEHSQILCDTSLSLPNHSHDTRLVAASTPHPSRLTSPHCMVFALLHSACNLSSAEHVFRVILFSLVMASKLG